MKIGILTIHDSPSYGGSLQCFALWKYITEMGYDCEVIDLHRPYAHKDYIPSKTYKRCRKENTSLGMKYKRLINSFITIFKNKQTYNIYGSGAIEKFKSFNNQIQYSKCYNNIDEFYKDPPYYDIYIAGSDQLWNPTQPYCIEPYFITFCNNKKSKKISYATSIGISTLTEREKILFRDWLKDFTAISVREQEAKELLESFTDYRIKRVIDPTFLIDSKDWKKEAIFPIKNNLKYILLFALNVRDDLLDFCIRVSKEAKLKLIVLNQHQHKSETGDYISVCDAGPREFLGYIACADLVITDSFHGTVFSLIMQVNNFFTYISPDNLRGGRIKDLLSLFNLKDHLLNPKFNDTFEDLSRKRINHEQIESTIHKEQTEGRQFLLHSIKGL